MRFLAPEGHEGFFVPFTKNPVTKQIADPYQRPHNLFFDTQNSLRDLNTIQCTTTDNLGNIQWIDTGDNKKILPGVMFVYKASEPSYAVPTLVVLVKDEQGGIYIKIQHYQIPLDQIEMLSNLVNTAYNTTTTATTTYKLIADEQGCPILFPLHNKPEATDPDANDLKKLIYDPSTYASQKTIPLINDKDTFPTGTEGEYSDRFFVGMIPKNIRNWIYLPVLVKGLGGGKYELIGLDPVEHVKRLISEQYETYYPNLCERLSIIVMQYFHTHDMYPRIKIGEGSRLQVQMLQTCYDTGTIERAFVAPEGHGGFFIPFTQPKYYTNEDLNKLLFDDHSLPRDPKSIKWTTIDQLDNIEWSNYRGYTIAPGVMFVYEDDQHFARPISLCLQKIEKGFAICPSASAIPKVCIQMLSQVVFKDIDLLPNDS